MKNQTDLIVSITAIVVALIVAVTCFFTMPQPQQPAAPAPVVTTPPALPEGSVKFSNGLPGGSNQGGGAGIGAPGAPAPAPGPQGGGGGQPARPGPPSAG